MNNNGAKPGLNDKVCVPSFYSRADEFSFKDLLAIFFSSGFFYICYQALGDPQALELVKAVGYLMAVILGGYFGQEITSTLVKEKLMAQRKAVSSPKNDTRP